MKFVFLTHQFYHDYLGCCEIEKKDKRPYIQVYTLIGGYLFAIPLRSNINHTYVLWTDKSQKCGVDFSKAVIVLKEEYIDQKNQPHIRQNEFNSLRGKEHIIQTKMIQYIREYKKAKQNPHIYHNRVLCQCSTLQYFDEIIELMQLK